MKNVPSVVNQMPISIIPHGWLFLWLFRPSSFIIEFIIIVIETSSSFIDFMVRIGSSSGVVHRHHHHHHRCRWAGRGRGLRAAFWCFHTHTRARTFRWGTRGGATHTQFDQWSWFVCDCSYRRRDTRKIRYRFAIR